MYIGQTGTAEGYSSRQLLHLRTDKMEKNKGEMEGKKVRVIWMCPTKTNRQQQPTHTNVCDAIGWYQHATHICPSIAHSMLHRKEIHPQKKTKQIKSQFYFFNLQRAFNLLWTFFYLIWVRINYTTQCCTFDSLLYTFCVAVAVARGSYM